MSCGKEDETQKQEILKKQLLTRLFIFAAESDWCAGVVCGAVSGCDPKVFSGWHRAEICGDGKL